MLIGWVVTAKMGDGWVPACPVTSCNNLSTNTDYFSGPNRAVGQVCVRANLELDDR